MFPPSSSMTKPQSDCEPVFPNNSTMEAPACGGNALELLGKDSEPIISESTLSAPDGWGYDSSSRLGDWFNQWIPHGGRIAGVYSLASVTLGSGIVSLPYAFSLSGIVVSVLVLVGVTLCTTYSVYILAQAVSKTGFRLCSYEALARGLLGRGWDYLAAFNMWMFCFGSCVSYVISVGDLIERATNDPSVNSFIRSKWGTRVLVIIVWAVAMLPLTIPKQVNSLRYVSVIGVSFMMYFVVMIIVHASMNGFENGKPKNTLSSFESGNNAIVGFSMFIFAYLCQTNCLEVLAEMQRPSAARLTLDTAISMSLCTCLYILAGVFGYLDFGNALTGSILRFYNVRQEVMVAIGYVGLGFKLCVSFAMCMQPSRDSLYYCLGWHVRTVPFWLNALVCSALSIVALILGIVIPNVEIVFGMVGSFCGGFLGFIFPALYIMYSGKWNRKNVGWTHWISTYVLLLCGVISVVFGTAASIYGVI